VLLHPVVHVRVRDLACPDGLVDVAGGGTQAEVPDPLLDGGVRVGEGYLEVRLLGPDLAVVRNPGGECARLGGVLLDARRRDRVALAADRHHHDRVPEVVLADALPHPLDALVRPEFDVDVHERARVDAAAPHVDALVGVELDEVVAALLALGRARPLGGPAVGEPGLVWVRQPLPPGLVVVAEEHRVEPDVGRGQHRPGVPVAVRERVEAAVAHEGGKVGVVGGEVVREPVPLRPRDEVQAVDGGLPDGHGLAPQPGRQPERLVEVQPLGLPLGLVVADDGEEGNAGVVQRPQHRQRAHDVREGGPAVVEQVAGVNHGVDLRLDGVRGDPPERRQEVLPALWNVVLLVPEVGVAGVDHPRHLPVASSVLPKGFPDRR